MTPKLWGGRFAEEPSALLRALNDSFGFDRELFAEDVEGSMAWARALESAGVLTANEVSAIRSIASRPSDVRVPSKLPIVSCPTRRSTICTVPSPCGVRAGPEAFIRNVICPPTGIRGLCNFSNLSSGSPAPTRSSATVPSAKREAEQVTANVARALAARALDEAGTPMPGYTHSKQAEPVSFGHWCLAYVEMLARDRSRFHDAVARNNECPLGSGALAGTPLNLHRDALAQSLGFARANRNSLDGVADRDLACEYLFNATMLLQHLSRLAEDLIFFTSDEAGYAELPDALATGSSRMPQKKNPDVLELVRGYAARTIGELTGLLSLLKALPLAYDKDLQLDKEPLFRTRTVLARVLPALAALIERLILNREAMRAAASSDALIATAVADAITATGVPFREAHDQVSRNLPDLAAMAQQHGVTLETILAAKSAIGGTAPERVREAARAALETP